MPEAASPSPVPPAPGCLVVVEGIDGSGKSTLLELLCAALAGDGLQRHFGARFTALLRLQEPTGGETGRRIREHLRAGAELPARDWLRLFFADRAENVRDRIRPALQAGALILQDRYFYSTAAYQGESRAAAAQIVQDSLAAGFPEPGLVLYLDIAPEEALARIHARLASQSAGGAPATAESFETLEQLQRIHRNYDAILPGHSLRLDARQTPRQLREIAIARIQSVARS